MATLQTDPATSAPDLPPAAHATLWQPIFAGCLAAIVGFSGAFPIVLKGLATVGATPAMAASGLLMVCVIKGFCGAGLSWQARMPVSVAWSTPGAALLITTGLPDGGFPAAVGAFIVAAALIVIAGLWRPFGRLVSSIPISLASAMLAGVLMEICLAPVQAVQQLPLLTLPIVVVWAVALRFIRLWAVPIAVAVTALIIAFATKLPPGSLDNIAPACDLRDAGLLDLGLDRHRPAALHRDDGLAERAGPRRHAPQWLCAGCRADLRCDRFRQRRDRAVRRPVDQPRRDHALRFVPDLRRIPIPPSAGSRRPQPVSPMLRSD